MRVAVVVSSAARLSIVHGENETRRFGSREVGRAMGVRRGCGASSSSTLSFSQPSSSSQSVEAVILPASERLLPAASFRSASDLATRLLRSEKRSARRSSAANTAASRSSASMIYETSVIAMNHGRERHELRSRGRSAATLVVRCRQLLRRFPTSLQETASYEQHYHTVHIDL